MKYKTEVYGKAYVSPKFKSLKTKAEDDDDDFAAGASHLGYFKHQQPLTKLQVFIDEPIKDPAYYRMVVSAIDDLSEGDVIEFTINSPGGSLDGMVSLVTAIQNTEAQTVARIVGSAHSAASILALNCDTIELSPMATMLVHSVRFGLGASKGYDAASQVKHINEHAEQIFRDSYEYFLEEQEIEQILQGRELWMGFDEINRRLKHKYDILQEIQDSECCGDPENCDDICACKLAKDE